jgi:hypothetical protein
MTMIHHTRTTHALIATLTIALAATLAGTVVAHSVIAAGHAAGADATTTTMAVATTMSEVEPTLDQLNALRAVLAPFESVDSAEAAGFERFGGCMSGPQGAQGIHFTHGERIGDPTLDVLRPEVLMYEPRPDGSLRLIGAEYLVFQQAWHDDGNDAAPVLLGREFTLNTTLLDEPFYALHVWVWQHNPLGLFANWNPLVGCAHPTTEGS